MTKFPRQKKKSSSFRAPVPTRYGGGLEVDVSDTSSSRRTESDITSLLSPNSLPDIDDTDDTTTVDDKDCESEITIKSPTPPTSPGAQHDDIDGGGGRDGPIQRFNEKLMPRRTHLSASNPALNAVAMSSTLPRQFPLARTKSITRSFVPAMLRKFEKSRSCDPEPKPPVVASASGHTVQTGSSGAGSHHPVAMSASNILNAGTESTRSSFVLYEPAMMHKHNLGYGDSGNTELGAADSGDWGSDDRGNQFNNNSNTNNKGFVKKCVSKVKSFIG